MQQAKALRQKLDRDEVVFGAFVSYSESSLAELLAIAGFDFLIFDGEHGSIAEANMPALAAACERRDCLPLVRVSSLAEHEVGRYLDAGAQGAVAPMVNTRERAQTIAKAMLYPPMGERGVAPTKAVDFGIGAMSMPQHMDAANENLLIVAQIETKEAVENIGDIVELERLDIVFIGPADLSVSLGCPMQFDHPDFISAIFAVTQAAKAAGKHVGAAAATMEQASLLHSIGVRFIAGYFDSMVGEMATSFIRETRIAIEEKKN